MSRSKGRPKAKELPGDRRKPRSDVAASVPNRPQPRREFTPTEADGKLIVLFSRIDVGGDWCLTKITQSDHLKLLDRIKSVESMTVHQLFNSDGKVAKDYDQASLPNHKARKRLEELQYDDRDKISRIEVGPTQRLFGFREGCRFYALWWDPSHQIWPSKKR